jgi:hypothetical protein
VELGGIFSAALLLLSLNVIWRFPLLLDNPFGYKFGYIYLGKF